MQELQKRIDSTMREAFSCKIKQLSNFETGGVLKQQDKRKDFSPCVKDAFLVSLKKTYMSEIFSPLNKPEQLKAQLKLHDFF